MDKLNAIYLFIINYTVSYQIVGEDDIYTMLLRQYYYSLITMIKHHPNDHGMNNV